MAHTIRHGARRPQGRPFPSPEMFLAKFCYPDWVNTKLMVADVFTKALDKKTFLKFRAALLNLDYEGYPPELHEMIH